MVAEDVVDRIRAYSESCREAEKERDSVALTAANYEEYNRQIDKTLRGLREQVQRQESALREVIFPCLSCYDTVMSCLTGEFCIASCLYSSSRAPTPGPTAP